MTRTGRKRIKRQGVAGVNYISNIFRRYVARQSLDGRASSPFVSNNYQLLHTHIYRICCDIYIYILPVDRRISRHCSAAKPACYFPSFPPSSALSYLTRVANNSHVTSFNPILWTRARAGNACRDKTSRDVSLSADTVRLVKSA